MSDEIMSVICKQCGRETGPAVESGCDQSYKPHCAWHIKKSDDDTFCKVYNENDFAKAQGEKIKNDIENGENFTGI